MTELRTDKAFSQITELIGQGFPVQSSISERNNNQRVKINGNLIKLVSWRDSNHGTIKAFPQRNG